MTTSSLRAEFARLGQIRAAGPEPCGSSETVEIAIRDDICTVDAIAAMLLLRRGGLSVLCAKRTIEAVLAGRRIVVEVPKVADAAGLERSMLECGFVASIRTRDASSVQSLRWTT